MLGRTTLPLLVLAALALPLAGVARANAQDDAARTQALLQAVAAGPADQRAAAAAELEALAPRVVGQLAEFLRRQRTSSPDARRASLQKIKAAVPDRSGRFQSPGRQQEAQIRADDAFDWLAALLALPAADDPAAAAALGETIADVAALRALAAARQVAAAEAILAVGFASDTIVYRDECGRQLRRMAPYSLPALVVGSQPRRKERDRDKALERYSTYQLERLDRQDPQKALDAASVDEDLRIAVLQAFGASEHREAAGVVFRMIDVEAPRVRAAAREAWLAYVTPPHPPEPPKKRLQLTGGKLADEETPLWLNSLQLAEIKLDAAFEELFGEDRRGSLEASTRRIFEHYDALRAARDAEVFAGGKALAERGDLPGALAVYDRLLADDPLRPERAAMAPTYFGRAEALAAEGKWAEAAGLYSKAHGLDPEGPRATAALAAHYRALGKAMQAEGKDGGAALRKAAALSPQDDEVHQEAAAAAVPAPGRPTWMLFAAGGAAAGAALLLLLGLARRSR
jgi:tetratricopeptide (TPR) repeat protein